ncbi:class I SAM-dependent methyltransferase [Nocardiopsis lambiniae]|uniref:Class I SAM-dependent methyltransferase n=1 Tax=Nocardiopsis lambiniae TaxID=3075539 RepID=A0ABU2MGW8_9ACTN|nr:class I SAM-dependent methyltransferase [Nocardiopsis sp. DSM 44743]MDT0331954.1 class I SAM-dependent methyltransferase [Nocardiopsis sp. DSM 44743]
MPTIDLDHISALYRTHRDDLARARDHIRALPATAPAPALDDIEAEITYLLIRHHTPDHVVRIGTAHSTATAWTLAALRDNGAGRLHTFDTHDPDPHHLPPGMDPDRWKHTKGDVRAKLTHLPPHTGLLTLDTAHGGWFARWYLHHLLPTLRPHTPIAVHGVFRHPRTAPFTEGALVLSWLANNTTGYFTASAARAPHTHQALTDLKTELTLNTPLTATRTDPAIFFHLPARPAPPSPTRPRAHATA